MLIRFKFVKINSLLLENALIGDRMKNENNNLTRLNAHLKRIRRLIDALQAKLKECYCEIEFEKVKWGEDTRKQFVSNKQDLESKLSDLHDQEHNLLYKIRILQS